MSTTDQSNSSIELMVYVYVVLLALAFMKVSVVPVLNIPKMSHQVSEPEMD